LSLLCLAILLAPFVMVGFFAVRDRRIERRDERIHARRERLIELFEDVAKEPIFLNRVYLQASDGTAYPYDLFMIEYRGGVHLVDTIWLPVRRFLNASDEELKQLLARELAQPGQYTIPDWQEVLYEWVKREIEVRQGE